MSQKLDNILSTYSYDARQKNQLRLADEKGLDIDIIKDPKYDWEQMREIVLAMEFGLDPAPLFHQKQWKILEFICLKIKVFMKMQSLIFI